MFMNKFHEIGPRQSVFYRNYFKSCHALLDHSIMENPLCRQTDDKPITTPLRHLMPRGKKLLGRHIFKGTDSFLQHTLSLIIYIYILLYIIKYMYQKQIYLDLDILTWI